MNGVVTTIPAPNAKSDIGDRTILGLVGIFGGAAHALPEVFYLGGFIGPFDVLVLIVSLRWLATGPFQVPASSARQFAVFATFALFAYIGEFSGDLVFPGNTMPGVIAPVRFLSYPTLIFSLQPLLTSDKRLDLLFKGFVIGVLIIGVLAWIRSPDPTFFFGMPVLFDPNVTGNFIAYGMVVLGFACVSWGGVQKLAMTGIFFVLSLFTFSKASWLMGLIGLYLNISTVNRWVFIGIAVLGATLSPFFVDYAHLVELVSNAIDLKLAASVGGNGSAEAGSVNMRFGFFLTSIYSLFQYPFGVGLKNFFYLNHSFLESLGPLYFDSTSPHTAFGFAAVQAGWVGVMLLAAMIGMLLRGLFGFYGRNSLVVRLALSACMIISVFFQIEIVTQPFIYLVLAGAAANQRIRLHTFVGGARGAPVFAP